MSGFRKSDAQQGEGFFHSWTAGFQTTKAGERAKKKGGFVGNSGDFKREREREEMGGDFPVF